MFCLRSWIPILFFLYAHFLTNASPIYLILFITATYLLNRPCVYCSLLLAILVVSLFDFQSPWFAPYEGDLPPGEVHDTSNSTLRANSTFVDNATAMAGAFAGTLNNTVAALAENITQEVKRRVTSEETVSNASSEAAGAGATWVGEWVRGAVTKREWRVPCLDVLIRL